MRKAATAVAAAVALVVGVVLGVSPAHANGMVGVVCPGSDTVTFNPGLRTFTQDVTFTSAPEGHSCTGIGKISGDNSFGAPFGGTLPLSCTTLVGPNSATQVFTWSPSGRTSTWAADSVEVAYVAGQLVLTYTGKITAGDYTGATLTDVEVFAASDLTACLSSPGLTDLSGTATWTFAKL